MDDDVAAVIEKIRRLQVGRDAGLREVLRNPESAAHFTLNADVAGEVVFNGTAQAVIAEPRALGVAALGEEGRAAGNNGDGDGGGPGADSCASAQVALAIPNTATSTAIQRVMTASWLMCITLLMSRAGLA